MVAAAKTPAGAGGITTISDDKANIERRARALMAELLAADVVYQITAPIYYMAEREEITWEEAGKDGTFLLGVEPYRVQDQNNPKNKEGVVLNHPPIMMVNGRGQTKDKNVAYWVKNIKKYEVIETFPNADLAAQVKAALEAEAVTA